MFLGDVHVLLAKAFAAYGKRLAQQTLGFTELPTRLQGVAEGSETGGSVGAAIAELPASQREGLGVQ